MSRVSKINGVLVTDTFVTGFTYNDANLLTISQNGQNDLSVGINYFSGLTITGDVSTYTLSSDTIYITSALTNNNSNTQLLTRNTSTGKIEYRDSSSISGGGVSGDYLPLSGGTVTGNTVFTSGLTATTLSFNTTYTGSTPYGTMSWNTDFGTAQIGMIGGNVVQKVGESVYSYVKNVDTTPLTKGEVVYLFGASGDKISVKRASNTGDTTSSKTLGVVADTTISVNGLGYVITKGTLDGLNLGAYSSGTILWLSSTPGQFTNVKQYAPYHLVFIGVVQRANAGNGQLYVSPQNGYELEELHDVMATGATYGDIIVYSAYNGNDVWVSTKTLTGNYTINGNLTVTGNTNIQSFTAGTGTINGNLTVTGNTNIQSFTAGTGTINGNLTVTGTTSGNTFYGSGIGLTNIPISGVTNLQNSLNNKFDTSGGTVSGSVVVTGNVTILGTATTINTDTLSIKDNLITLNSNLTGATDQPFFGNSGIEILRGSATTTTLLWDESNLKWYAGLTGSTKQILLSGDSLSLLSSGHTHPISEINNLQSSLNDKFDKSGGTINGSLTVTGSTSLQSFTAGTGTINGNLLVTGTSSASTVTITSTPNFNNDNTQILTRNSTNGNIEYSDSSSANIFNYGLANAMVNLNFLT